MLMSVYLERAERERGGTLPSILHNHPFLTHVTYPTKGRDSPSSRYPTKTRELLEETWGKPGGIHLGGYA